MPPVVEVEAESDVEYWSAVETTAEGDRVTMVLRDAEICQSCRWFKFVFVVTMYSAECLECSEKREKR